MKIRIYYEDTDMGGIVYHSNYISYCERARSELFFQKGLKPHDEAMSEFFVVRRVECDFLKSAKFADIVEVKTKVIEKRNTSMTLEQNIVRGEELLFKAKVTVVYLKNGKPSKIPLKLIDIIDE